VTGQKNPEMLSDSPSRTTGSFKIGQVMDLKILRKAVSAVGMEGVARHGRTLMA
jgi:hypothetical protein